MLDARQRLIERIIPVDLSSALPLFGLRLSFESAAPLPRLGFHGSWLRGLLGHALFRGVCVYSEPCCGECALRETCAYPQIFKPHLLPGPDRLPGYVLHDWCVPTGAMRGHCILILIGRAGQYAETWIRHLHIHAPALAMPRVPGGQLRTVHDLASGALLFAQGRFQPGRVLTLLPLLAPPHAELTVRFHTPIVSKHALDSDPLWGPLRTRIRRLLNDYGTGAPPTSTDPPWRVAAVGLQSTVIPRGTDSPRRVQGYTGWVRLTHISPEGAMLLALGRYVHAGGETSLGFGRYGWDS